MANPNTATITEDSASMNFNVISDDTDVENNPLTVTTSYPTATIISNQIAYSPPANFFGTVTIPYTISDGNGGSAQSTLTITVTPVNDAPVLQPDTATTPEGTAVLINVLANDSDVDSTALTVTAVSTAANGQATIVSNQVRYLPNDYYFGTDTFTYTVFDGTTSVTSTVTVTISSTNNAPFAIDDNFDVTEDTKTTLNVLANDYDVEQDSFEILYTTQPAHGLLVSSFTGPVTYTPDKDYTGSDTFQYAVIDSAGAVNTATVFINVLPVNDNPVAVNDFVFVLEDALITIPVLSNDFDIEGNTLQIQSVGVPSYGTAVIAGNNIVYDSNADFNGHDIISYTISDRNGGSATASVIVIVAPVNDAPTLRDDNVVANENTQSVFDVLGNDSDADGDSLSILSVVQVSPSIGNIIIRDDRIYYTPSPNASGTDTFRYIASDGNGATSIATVTVRINLLNDAPVPYPDYVRTFVDTSVTYNVLDNDVDPDGDTLTLLSLSSPPSGSVTSRNSDGSFTYQPSGSFVGVVSMTYTATDGTNTVTGDVFIVINARVSLVANDDSVRTLEDTKVTFTVIGNDVNSAGVVLFNRINVQPYFGSLQINADGSITYTPSLNFNGEDSIVYSISDGISLSSFAIVTITVTAVNDAPEAYPDTAYVYENSDVYASVLANDIDVDDDVLTISSVSTPTNGLATIVSNQVHYVPNSNFYGVDSFSYTVTDGFASVTTSITVIVQQKNTAPVVNDDLITTAEDVAVSIQALVNDTDAEGDELVILFIGTPAHGTVTLQQDRSILYTPNANFNGVDAFIYAASDGNGGIDQAQITVTVSPLNDAPNAVDDEYQTFIGTPITFNPLANDEEYDGDSITIVSVTSPSKGSTLLNADNTITYTPDLFSSDIVIFYYIITDSQGATDTGKVYVTLVSSHLIAVTDVSTTVEDTAFGIDILANDENRNGGPITFNSFLILPEHGTISISPQNRVTYTPDPNYNGPDSFVYSITDGNGFYASGLVTLVVTAVNDAPVAVVDFITTTTGTAVYINALVNDYDVDNELLLITSVSAASHGTVSFIASGILIYTSSNTFTGTDSFTYTIQDPSSASDSAEVSLVIDVNPNSGPVAVEDAEQLDEDTSIVIDVLSNDFAPNGRNSIVIAAVTVPTSGKAIIVQSGTKILYTPAANYFGNDEFTYTIVDRLGFVSTTTVSLTIAPVNDAPIANPDYVSVLEDNTIVIPVLANDNDPDGDVLTITTVSVSVGSVTFDNNGILTYIPPSNYNGEVTITYTVTDNNGGTNSTTVTVFVNAVNDFPVAVDDTAFTPANVAISIPVLANDYDNDPSDSISITSASDPAHGTTLVQGNRILYTPDSLYNGPDTFTYLITDGHGGVATATVSVSVSFVNLAPVALPDSATTNEDTPVNIFPLNNDRDPENAVLSIIGVSSVLNGDVLFTSTVITYTPAANFNGIETFTYTVSDPDGMVDIATIQVTVNAMNDLPVATNDILSVIVPLDTPSLVLNVLSNDYDPDDTDSISLSQVNNPTTGSIQLNANQTLTFTPPSVYFTGAVTFTYSITDGVAESPLAVVTLIFSYTTNSAPTFNPDQLSANHDGGSVNVLANDVDIDGVIRLVSVSQPTYGIVFADYTTGLVSYIPNSPFVGNDSFTYTACDNQNRCGSATVYVTLTDNNSIPVANDDVVLSDQYQAVTFAPLANDYDLDGDSLTIYSIEQPEEGSIIINSDGTATFTPKIRTNTNQITVSYILSDVFKNQDTATITLYFGNLPPWVEDDNYLLYLGQTRVLDVLSNDYDPDGDDIFITDVSSNSQLATVTISADKLSLNITAGSDFQGRYSFTYTVSDGNGGSSSANVIVNVSPASGEVIAVTDKASTFLNSAVTIPVLSNDVSIGSEFDFSSLLIIQEPVSGIATVSSQPGSIVYTPLAGFIGSDIFTYSICNMDGFCAGSFVTIQVSFVPASPSSFPTRSASTAPTPSRSPVPTASATPSISHTASPTPNRFVSAVDDVMYVDNDDGMVFDVLENDSGAINVDSLSILFPPVHGIATVSGGEIFYIPDETYTGPDRLNYQICSLGNYYCSTAAVYINVFRDYGTSYYTTSSLSTTSSASSSCISIFALLLFVLLLV